MYIICVENTKNICVVAIKDHYRNCLASELKRLRDYGWTIHVLTDDSTNFHDHNYELYPYTIFSYIDKILFPIRTSINLKQSVLSVDADRVRDLSDEFLDIGVQSNNFLYLQKWPAAEYLGFYVYGDSYFDILLEYFISKNFNYDKLPCILEQIFYIPYFPELHKTRLDIEHLKPILEYISILHDFPYPGIGNGEGVALSYGIKNNNFNLEKFNIYPYKQFKPNRFI